MTTINIRRDVNDPFYRYKMPKLITKVEGRGNGIKTVIPNMADVAKALSRPPTYTTKFFGTELGAQVKIEADAGRYILTGAHDQEKLQNTLDAFIDKFVLCGSCKNPETDLLLAKDGVILKDCKACGSKTPADMAHKLVTFITRELNEIQRKAKKEKKKKQEAEEDQDDITKMIEDGAALIPEAGEEDEEDFLEDTSADAVAKRQKELNVSGAVAKLMIEDDKIDENDPFEQFSKFVLSNTKNPAALVQKAKEIGIRADKACTVLVITLLNENFAKEKQVQKYANVFKAFLNHEKSESAILGGVERLVSETYPELSPKVALIFKDLYDLDIVTEDAFLRWEDHISKKYVEKSKAKMVRKKAAPFINWLREASEDEDESD